MNFLTHTLTFLLGAVALIVVVGIVSYHQPYEFAEGFDYHGKVVATTLTLDYHACDEKGFTLVELHQSKKYVILCGVNEEPGQKITVTLDEQEGVQL